MFKWHGWKAIGAAAVSLLSYAELASHAGIVPAKVAVVVGAIASVVAAFSKSPAQAAGASSAAAN